MHFAAGTMAAATLARPADATPDRRASWGGGLGPLALLGILAASVAIFLWLGGPLWRAPVGASHLLRIVVSYLVVVPMVAAALLATRRYRSAHLISGVALVWTVKLLITSSLYYYLTPEAAQHYAPARGWERPRAPAQAPTRSYRAAAAPGMLRDVAGTVVVGATPIAGAVVAIDRPPPGLPAEPASTRAWTIRAGRHDEPVHLAGAADRITAVNLDPRLHTVTVSSSGRTWSNVPLPAGTPQIVPTPPPGIYEISCESHGGERATLVVVDHPYAALADATGRFALRGVPAAAGDLVVVAPGRAPLRRAIGSLSDPIDLEHPGHPISGGGE